MSNYLPYTEQSQTIGMALAPPSPPPPSWSTHSKAGSSATELELSQTSWFDYETTRPAQPVFGLEKSSLPADQLLTPPPPFTPQAVDLASGGLQSTYLMRKTARFGPTWAIACLTLIASAVTTYYSTRVMVDQRELPSALALSPGRTVLVVNVLSKLTAFLSLSLFTDIIEALRWTLACRAEGLLLTSFLTMSRATPIMGVVYLCKIPGLHQIWAIQRFLAYAITFVISIVLITDVTFKVVYTPYSPKAGAAEANQLVVAGLAPVGTYGLSNISLSLVPLLATTYTLAFITDPRFVTNVAPVNCTGGDLDCLSILIAGGMESVRFFNESGTDSTESPSLISGNFPGDYDSIVVNDAPAYQMEYQSIASYDSSFRFNRSETPGDGGDCEMHLQSIDDGLLFCQRQVGNMLYLGWSICPDAQFDSHTCQTDSSWSDTVAWNTTVAMYSRRATVAYDRQNVSILSVESMTPPTEIQVPAMPFDVYTEIIMGSVSQNLNRTKDPTGYAMSSTQFTFGYGVGYILRLYRATYSSYIDGGVYLLRSLIAVPFQFSTAIREFGNPNQMPDDNKVTAALSVSAYRALIEPWTVWTFAFLSLFLTIWSITLLLWMSLVGPYSPNISFFPEIDITSKSTAHPTDNGAAHPDLEIADKTLQDLARLTRNYGLGNGASRTVLEAVRGKRVYCGSLPGSSQREDHIVLVTEEGRLKVLTKYQKYS